MFGGCAMNALNKQPDPGDDPVTNVFRDEFVTKGAFCRLLDKDPRTVTRWMRMPNGLPHARLGRDITIQLPTALQWLRTRCAVIPNPTLKRMRSHRRAVQTAAALEQTTA